ncbi:MAG: RNA polymerase sigma factor SigJ [Pseudomonadota bacterium]
MSASADAFERERPRLTALAYRMLGERAGAEDVVQDTWLRWAREDRAGVADPGAWLRRAATRLAIDALRSARARREDYVGPWLPEPLLVQEGPETAFGLAQEARLALVWAMERLGPEERAAFILKDAFDADYGEIAEILGKSEPACRQIVSRARARLKDGAPRFDAAEAEVAGLLGRFVEAAASADRAAALALFAPDVVAVSDGGGKARAALRVLEGPEDVVTVLFAVMGKTGGLPNVRPVRANGAPALALLDGSEQEMVATLAPDADGRIAWLYVMRNPDKLAAARAAAETVS